MACLLARIPMGVALLFAILAVGCNKPKPNTSQTPNPKQIAEKSTEASPPETPEPGESVAVQSAEAPNPGALEEEKEPAREISAQQAAGEKGKDEQEEVLDALKRLKERALEDANWAREQASLVNALAASLKGKNEAFKVRDGDGKVPAEWDEASLREELKKAAGEAGVELAYLETSTPEVRRPEIPEEVPDRKSFTLTLNHVRDVHLLVMRLNDPSDTGLAAFLEALKEIRPLPVPTRLQFQRGKVLLNAEFYTWRTPRLPRRTMNPLDLKRDLRRTGVTLSVEEAVKLDPIGHLQHSALSVKTYNSMLNKVQRSLELQQQLAFLALQNQFLDDVEKQSRETTLSTLRDL